MKTIGILGGMGPEATAELYLKIIRIFQEKYGAKYDDDFPEMVILNLPIPDVVEDFKQEIRVREMLVSGVQKLEKAGADFIAIPCNSVNFCFEEMQEAVAISILNLLNETAKVVKAASVRKVGLLGTETTISKNIYGSVLSGVEIVTLGRSQQKQMIEIIMRVLAGDKREDDKRVLLQMINELQGLEAEKVILGCTELPLLVEGSDTIVDTIDVLAKAVVREVGLRNNGGQ